jgi:hypothetical protein
MRPCPFCHRPGSTCWVMPCLELDTLLHKASPDSQAEHDLADWATAVGVELRRKADGSRIPPRKS